MTARRLLTAVLIAGFAAAGSAACSSEERPERADTVQAPSAPATTEASETPDENAAADVTLSDEQTKAALLTVQDLPTGWTVDASAEEPEEDSDDAITPDECAAVFRVLEEGNEPAAKAEGSYSSGGLGPILQQTVTSFDDDTAEKIESVTEALNECPTFSSTDADGLVTEFTAAPLSFPNLGDRSLAVRLTASNDDINASFDLVYIGVGKNAIALFGGGLTPMQGTDLEAVGRKSVERLNAAAGA